MLFHSPEFLFGFLPIVLIGYFVLRRLGGLRTGLAFLALVSLFFYGWWDPRFVPLLLGSVAFNFLLGRAIARRRWRDRPTGPLLTAGIAANLAALGFFKYANFFILSLNGVADTGFPLTHIVLPLAISFFTFQQIAFLVDAHTGRTIDTDPLSYLLFVTFFPQLIAGPIVHHGEMMPQFAQGGTEISKPAGLAIGLTIFAIGLFKKVVVARTMGFWSDRVFDVAAHGASVSFLEAWVATLSFSFQIYFDFSGYSDMAIGLGHMFGIRLPANFESPYRAESIIDFWRRWHMTLSRFLRDYLYFPLGGNRRGKVRRYVNVVIVMVLGGLWHGAAWTFVVWGALHAAYLVVNHAWRALMGGPATSPAARWAARILTFFAATLAWVPFRAASFAAASQMYRGLAGLDGVILPLHYQQALGGLASLVSGTGVRFGLTPGFGGGQQIGWLLLTLLGVWLLPNTQQIMRRYAPVIGKVLAPADNQAWGLAQRIVWMPSPALGIAIGVATAVIALHVLQGTPGEFIYFQF